MTLSAEIMRIPFVDHHVHQPNKGRHVLTVEEFRRPFTESALPEVWREHLGTLIGYRWMVRELAAVLGVVADEATVVAARNATPEAEYHRMLADLANLGPS